MFLRSCVRKTPPRLGRAGQVWIDVKHPLEGGHEVDGWRRADSPSRYPSTEPPLQIAPSATNFRCKAACAFTGSGVLLSRHASFFRLLLRRAFPAHRLSRVVVFSRRRTGEMGRVDPGAAGSVSVTDQR